MSGAANNDPEPIEDRIANAIKKGLEPFVVSLLAALIAPSQCAQGIDWQGDDQRRKAIETGRMLLGETRTRLSDFYDQIERYDSELEALHKRQQRPEPQEEYLHVSMKLGDDSFRTYLREQNAPRRIQDRDAIAHYRALVRLKLGGLLIADRTADGELFGYRISKRVADNYIELERKVTSSAVAKSREKSAKKNRKNSHPKFPKS